MLTEKPPKTPEQFECESCSFECSKYSDYSRHLSTRKHKRTINANENIYL